MGPDVDSEILYVLLQYNSRMLINRFVPEGWNQSRKQGWEANLKVPFRLYQRSPISCNISAELYTSVPFYRETSQQKPKTWTRGHALGIFGIIRRDPLGKIGDPLVGQLVHFALPATRVVVCVHVRLYNADIEDCIVATETHDILGEKMLISLSLSSLSSCALFAKNWKWFDMHLCRPAILGESQGFY